MRKDLRVGRRRDQRKDCRGGGDSANNREKQADKKPDGFHIRYQKKMLSAMKTNIDRMP